MRYLIFISVFLVSAFAKAQLVPDIVPKIEEQPRNISDTLGRKYDERKIEVRQLEDLREKYSGNEFDYTENRDQSQNFISEFLENFFNFLGDIFGIKIGPFWTKVLTYVIYFIIGGIAIYFIVRLLSNEAPSRLIARKSVNKASVTIDDTHIEQIDLKKYVEDSIASGDYRSAVRYLYLDVLKDLSARGAIEWNQQKSNADYYREIKNPAIKERFKKISYLYDHVWYGEFELDRVAFNKARRDFTNLYAQAA
jgi:hypothetical protein